MKEMWKLLGMFVIVASVARVINAACASSDFWCYQSGPSTNLTTQGQLSSGGNLTLNGGPVIIGKTVLTPTSQVTVSTQVPIAITATWMQIESTGAVVEFVAGSAYPAITTATATSGQYLVLSSTSSASSVIIETGTFSGVVGTNKYIVITSTRSAIPFLFNSTLQQWIAIGTN